jgi:hypothetical protein
VFFFLQLASWLAFIIGGIVGYAVKGWVGCAALFIAGWLFGMWMRRSLGQRPPDPFHGFYRRTGERAKGSYRGLLEWLIETMRGSGLSQSQCQRIWIAYERAMTECQVVSLDEQQRILQQLDKETKRISYSEGIKK